MEEEAKSINCNDNLKKLIVNYQFELMTHPINVLSLLLVVDVCLA